MRREVGRAVGVLCLLCATLAAAGTLFTYQGRLTSANQPEAGVFDLVFQVWNLESGGEILAGPVTNFSVLIEDGLLTTVVEFSETLSGTNLWLDLSLRHVGEHVFHNLNPRQRITPTPLATYALTADGVTAGRTLVLGNDLQAKRSFGGSSYTNVLVGVSSTNVATPGGNIALPDWGGLMWASGAAIFDWHGHSLEGGTPRNELQILGQSKICLACYGLPDGNAGIQIGGSGPYHDHVWFQYDSPSLFPGVGWSKLLQFVTRSGTNNTYAYSAIQGVGADTSSGKNMIRFYSGQPLRTTLGTGTAFWAGDVMTNGWNLRGRLVQQHHVITNSGTLVLSMDSARAFTVTLNGDAHITLTNWSTAAADFEERSLWIRSGGSARVLTWSPGIRWTTESGSSTPGAAPDSIDLGEAILISLQNLGGKVLASVKRSEE